MESGYQRKPTPLHSMHYNVCMDKSESKLILEALEALSGAVANIEERLAVVYAVVAESGYTNADYDL